MRRRTGRWALAALVAAGASVASIGTQAADARVAPRAGANAVVTPSSGLTDGQAVDVSATGLNANAPVVIGQCATVAAPDPGDCDALNFVNALSTGTGALDASYTVHAAFTTGLGGLIDCRVTACEILVVDLGGSSNISFLRAPISFAPGGPRPAITATPATGLADGQTVTVHGTGFTGPQPIIAVLDCIAADEAATCLLVSGAQTIVPATDGSFDADVTVPRILHDANGARVDCATTACELLALDVNSVVYNARAPIAFDPTLPPPAPPAITVTPNRGLGFHAPVDVSGTGWAPGSIVDIVECGRDAADPCSLTAETIAVADPTGAIDTPLTVHRMITDPSSVMPPVDCASEPGRCVVVAFDFATNDFVEAPLTFDPNAPIPPPPLVKTSATRGIADRQPIRFEASRLTPRSNVDLSLCAASENSAACEGFVGYPLAVANGAGRFTTTVIGRRSFTLDFGDAQTGRARLRARGVAFSALFARRGTAERVLATRRLAAQRGRGPWTWRSSAPDQFRFDCASPRVSCNLLFSSVADDFFASVPFSIDPRRTPGERAAVKATPSTGLRDGATVTIDTTSTSFGAFVGQCALDRNEVIACNEIVPIAPDALGHGRRPLVVRRWLRGFGREAVDCRAHRCAVLYSPGLGNADILSAPITFKA